MRTEESKYEFKGKVRFLGLGNYGCKQAKIFADMGYKVMYANGSKQDLKVLGDSPNIYWLRDFDGFGGFRERAIDCMAVNNEFVEALQNITEEILFIIYADGGSTGSGSSTVCAEIVLDNKDEYGEAKTTVCSINALPSSNEALVKHRNAYQAVRELQEIEGMGAAFFINNDSSDDYSYINNTFASMLDAFLTNDSYGELNNFDESEKMEMLRNGGAMIMSLVGNDKDSTVMLDKLTKNGIFAPVETDKVCENIAIIHAGKDNSDIKASEIIAEVGKSANVFEGYNNGRSLVVVSGLTYPISHVRKLGELAQKVSEERQRSRSMSVQKLGDLNLVEAVPSVVKEDKPKKNPSKLEMLRQKQAKMQQR